jgi:hypothetical protein
MKDVLIGALTGISAVVAMILLTPRPQPNGPAVRELTLFDNRRLGRLGNEYFPSDSEPVRSKLEKTTARVNVRLMPFEKVIEYLAKVSGQNFHVNWRALDMAGVHAHDPITLDMHDVPVSAILKAALEEVGTDEAVLQYCVVDGVVHISTYDDMAQHTVTRVYNVRDLIDLEVARASDSATRLTPADASDHLAGVIQEAIDPISWHDAGGTTGGLRFFSGRFVITQSIPNHDAILGLLAALRRADAPWPKVQPRKANGR